MLVIEPAIDQDACIEERAKNATSGIEKLKNPTTPTFQIWVDADACPADIKAILFRTAIRRKLDVIFVANQSLRLPSSNHIRMVTVRHGLDVADQTIAESMQQGDIVITADIPLAAQVVENAGIAIGPRGEKFDANNIQSKLASRNLMDHLRNSGMETGGPKPINRKDVQAFANQLDRAITKHCSEKNPDA